MGRTVRIMANGEVRMNWITAIKQYFENVTMQELKDLTPKEREELGRGACEAMGEKFTPTAK